VAGWYSLWFALYLAAPQVVHPCPSHSAAASAVAAPGEGHHHAGQHVEHAPVQQHDKQSDASDCCCPGPQCGASMALAAASQLTPLAQAVTRAVVAPHGAALVARAWPAFFLPFSTAPPASVA
jgi:hypothetical protein